MHKPTHAVVLFAHGARRAAWADPFRQLCTLVATAKPTWRVELAFLECMTPDLPTLAAQLAADGITHVVLVPLFLASGGHVHDDLPRLVAALATHHPHLQWHITPALGEDETLLQAIATWVCTQSTATN